MEVAVEEIKLLLWIFGMLALTIFSVITTQLGLK